ncbi:MAG: OmpH family outer membrane protein [Candidatus Aminicenantales bacterium]
MMTGMKNIILGTFLLTSVLVLSTFAQQSINVAVIDSQKAFLTSVEGKKASSLIQEREQKIKADTERLEGQLRSLQTKLNTQKLTLSEEALLQLQSDIEKKSTERKRYEEDASKDYQQFVGSLIQKIRNEMILIIRGLATEKRLDLVVDLATGGVVFFNPNVDITSEVVRRYDASKAAQTK